MEESVPDSRIQRETRSAARKRNFDVLAQFEEAEGLASSGSPDSILQEDPADAEEKSASTKGKKRSRKSAGGSNQAAWKKELQERLTKAEEQRKTLGTQLKKVEASLKSVTKESVLNARRGTKGVWDQGKIEAEWKNLKKDIKSWVKKHGIAKKISTLSDSAKEEILSARALHCDGGIFSEDNFNIIENLQRRSITP